LTVVATKSNTDLLAMRPATCALLCVLALLVVGFARPTRSSSDPSSAPLAIQDKSERIKPEALEGIWFGEKGSVLQFGKEHKVSVRLGNKGNPVKGTYKLEGYTLILQERALGTLSLLNPTALLLATSRDKQERFRKIA